MECHYDGGTEEFSITVNGATYKVSNLSADKCKLYPYAYLHRKENKLTLSVKWVKLLNQFKLL